MVHRGSEIDHGDLLLGVALGVGRGIRVPHCYAILVHAHASLVRERQGFPVANLVPQLMTQLLHGSRHVLGPPSHVGAHVHDPLGSGVPRIHGAARDPCQHKLDVSLTYIILYLSSEYEAIMLMTIPAPTAQISSGSGTGPGQITRDHSHIGI